MIEAASKIARIEFRKQLTSSAFLILLVLHTVVVVLVALNLNGLLANASILIDDIPQIQNSLGQILQFPDIWQNLTYVAGYFKIILALIIIISVCNEFSLSTARQHIVNGLSRMEFILSKLYISLFLALYSTIVVISICLFLGFSNTDQTIATSIFTKLDFTLAYALELIVYFIYALFLAVLVRRTGIALMLLLVYDFILEPVIGWSIPDAVYRFLPMNALDSLNTFPFAKYVGGEVQNAVAMEQFAWVALYGIAFTALAYLIFKKQDL